MIWTLSLIGSIKISGSKSQCELKHQYENLPKLKAGLHRLPEVNADLPELNLEANSEAISSQIRMTYYKKYIENEPPVGPLVEPPVEPPVELPVEPLAAESAGYEPEENVAL